jgi:CRP-like cAMP-binding protein
MSDEPKFLERQHHNNQHNSTQSDKQSKKLKGQGVLENIVDENLDDLENAIEFIVGNEEEYREEKDIEDFLDNDDISLKSEQDVTNDKTNIIINNNNSNNNDDVLLSYQNEQFNSEEMRLMIELQKPQEHISGENQTAHYNNKTVFPDWLLHDSDWKRAKGESNKNNISEILQLLPHSRNADQVEALIYWLQSVWPIAKGLTFARCAAMLKEFKYFTYESGVNIITENERGLTFYIIVSGDTEVIKDGIGVVAQLGKGKSFGEIALTQGKDLRTATVRTLSKVETLSLHKSDYDHFIRDIQMAEKRENYFLLRDCKLFSSWPRTKIDRLSNLCQRKNYEAGAAIFKQGDAPDNLYIIMDGTVEIIKELQIICKNRWPTGMNSWSGIARRKNQPFTIQILPNKGDYFGELSIIRNTKRTATAIASTKCSIVIIDRLEFLHLLRTTTQSQNTISNGRGAEDHISDERLLESLGNIKGGPSSMAVAGTLTIYPNDPRSRTASPKRKKKEKKQREDDYESEDYFKKMVQTDVDKNITKVQISIADHVKEVQDKAVDDKIYFTETNTTLSAAKNQKRLGFDRINRMTLPTLTNSQSDTKIVFEPVERNLAQSVKYKIKPKPGEQFLPLAATVVQLDTLESTGRRVRSYSTTNLKNIRERVGSPEKNQLIDYFENEMTGESIHDIPEINYYDQQFDIRKKKYDSDLSLLRKKKLSYRDVINGFQ